MPSKHYPIDIAEQVRAIVESWKEIDPVLPIGGLALSTLEAELAQAATLYAQIDSLEAQFIDLRNQRDAIGASLWDKVKRVRTGVKSHFGDDSSKYEMMGGTRISDCKRPVRQHTAA